MIPPNNRLLSLIGWVKTPHFQSHQQEELGLAQVNGIRNAFPMMFWSGIVILVIGILGAAFKVCVVWNASRDPFRGGGVPTFDFVVFWPIPIALGIGLILNAEGIASYYGVGVPLYLLIFLAFRWLHIWFDKLGEPERNRQLAVQQNRRRTNHEAS
ncbi:hypothetical protein LOC68_27715 [Blastopirellula sp. JC732]|uniref:Uncharacterized protein n=1 Tax=Blastopirellula sediminis TaxID=2894196 RepID=A0A9X1SID9_9BACT|nr:hypothetical protein [Blastopirellula sediminis]MCC9604501.1 hypothetical protein [Blastopirellula sediminis]MCC9632200.1 hypothetical protein [Blastopirellula sediminis]